ncbi:MAG TPA: hypothetical protein VMU33_08505 [Burkholderiaceae bacterium]|nr:hypothetical protein [Burkholderiaceae bacterium]
METWDEQPQPVVPRTRRLRLSRELQASEPDDAGDRCGREVLHTGAASAAEGHVPEPVVGGWVIRAAY